MSVTIVFRPAAPVMVVVLLACSCAPVRQAAGGPNGKAVQGGEVLPASKPLVSASQPTSVATGRLPAFPGAEGFGAYTVGGRGGKVIYVTTLEDNERGKPVIPGSIREAVEAQGPRIVLFKVGGTIFLKQRLRIRNPFITTAGQTAPGDGICLAGTGTNVDTHDVVLRYLRFRPGDIQPKITEDALGIDSPDVIVDHCSVSWSIDEALSVSGPKADRITVQWCIISESLTYSLHKKGRHGMGSLIITDGGSVTFHHNLYAHHNSRVPRPGASNRGSAGTLLDFRNNVLYDWGSRAGYSNDTSVRMNYVNNYLRPGPSTKDAARKIAFNPGGPLTFIFMAGNYIEGFPEAGKDNWLAVKFNSETITEEDKAEMRRPDPFPVSAVKTDRAKIAYDRVLEGAGDSFPVRDAVDKRIIRDVRTGKGKLIDSQKEVGGWPDLKGGSAPLDSDGDGMPDVWEKAQGLNRDDPADGSMDSGNGYTNVEKYLNEIVVPRKAKGDALSTD